MTEPLDPDLLLRAYAIGVFPMADRRDAPDVYWVEPRQRAIIPLDGFHLSRSLAKSLRSGRFDVTMNRAFEDVVQRCAQRESTWINSQLERSYNLLHSAGHAHSIEVWEKERLVGGLYGVRLGAAFFGESMFSSARDASKVGLAWLVARLKIGGFELLDCQFMTDHLHSLGAREIAQADYLKLLASALGASSATIGAGGSTTSRESSSSVRADLEALDRLLGSRTTDSPPPGWVIAQLIGETS